MRTQSYAQQTKLTVVDRLGVWLSARTVRRFVPSFRGKRVGDLGCGFQAAFVRSILHELREAVVVDVALADDLKDHPRIRALEAALPECLDELPDSSLDVVLLLSVLEHLSDPLPVLEQAHRLLVPGGRCLVNVPSWRGKAYLELSAFTLGTSPACEMDDHKMYYDVRDLWPLLVKAGFRPSAIRCFAHKAGLNTFAVCDREPEGP